MIKVMLYFPEKVKKTPCSVAIALLFLISLLPGILKGQATIKTRVTGNANWSAPSTWIQLRSGNISYSTGSVTVSGTSTSFLSELQTGDIIMSDVAPSTIIGTVASIQSNTSLTLTATSGASAASVSFGRQTLPSANDNVQIGNTSLPAAINVTLDISATVNSLTFVTDARSNSLTHSSNQSLTVTNGVTLNQPTVAATVAWNINSGTATVGGTISFNGSVSSTTRICTLNLSSGILSANGGMSFALSNNASKIINISGSGTINLKGALTVPSGTFNAGTSSIFNYCDAVNTQTVTLFPTGGYRHLYLNNTSGNGAVLAGAITATKVTGDINVASGSFNNGGYAIALSNGSNFSVANGARFVLTGTSGMVSGTGITKSFSSASTVEYGGGSQTVSNENYGNLILSNAGTKSLPASVLNIAGNFTTAGSISFTANNSLNIGGSIILGSGTTANGGSSTHYIGGDWQYNGANLSGTATINFNGTGTQTIGGTADPLFYNVVISNSSSPVILGRNIGVVGTLNLNAGSVLIPDSSVTINSSGASGSITGSGTVKVTNATGNPDFAAQYNFSSKNISALTISFSALGDQTIDALSYYNLIVEGSGTKMANGNININGSLNVSSGSTLSLNTYSLNGTLAGASGSGVIETKSTSAMPLPSGKSWIPSVQFNRTTGGQTIVAGTYTTLESNNTSGINTIASSIAVDSLLALGSGAAVTIAPATIASIKDIILSNNTVLTVNNSTLQISGSVSGGGIIDAANGEIEMNGTSAQSVAAGLFSSNTVNNLTINNNAGVTLNGPLSISGMLYPVVGSLNSNGNLTLLSNAAQTALIDGSGNGNVTGDVTMQRYLPSSFGYRYFSSPFQASTVAEFSDDMNLSAPFPSFYRYNESLNSAGWEDYTAGTNVLEPFIGYAVQMGTSNTPSTVDVTGAVNNGTIMLNPIENNNKPYTQGFHLIGNPYPSPIDWNMTVGWSRTNIDDAIYFFNPGSSDQYTGTYSSYINGVSSDGTTNNIIASMQGFFVHVSNGTYPVSGSITINNNARINNLSPTFHKAASPDVPLFRFSVNNPNNAKDYLTVYFNSEATERFDKRLEALKILNTDTTAPLIYAISSDHEKLSIIAATGQGGEETVIPLALKQFRGSTINFSTEISGTLPIVNAFLLDAQTGNQYNLLQQKAVTLALSPGLYSNRFYIVFTDKDKATVNYKNELTAFVANHYISVVLNAETGRHGTLKIVNISGQVVSEKTMSGYGVHTIDQSLPDGIYVALFESTQGVFKKKLLTTSEQ